MTDKLRLRVTEKGRHAGAETDEVLELDANSVPVTRIGGRGTRMVPKGKRCSLIPPPIKLVDWDKVPDKVSGCPAGAARSQTHDNEPTTFWLCTECARMVERAESEPLPDEGDCVHQWVPLEV